MWELLIQIVGEALIELGFYSLAETFRSRERRHPVLAGIGSAVIGSLFGLLSLAVLPHRILGVTGVPGASLILVPVANGVLMETFGRWREATSRRRSYFATYWAGAIFAFSVALVRFLGIEP